MAKIRSFTMRDATGAGNVGGLNEVATLTLNLDEALNATNGTINLNTVIPTLKVGATLIAAEQLSFVDYNPRAKTITYTVTLADRFADSKVTLSAISLHQITLTGAKNVAFSGTGLPLTANYSVDTIAPSFANTITSFTGSALENTSPSRTPLFTATATDNSNAVSYRLTGNDASLFNIDSRGVVRFKAAPNYESKNSFGFNVIASDRAGNTVSKAATVNVTNLDEPVGLAPGVRGTGTIVIAKGDIGQQGKTILADFVKNGTSNNPLSFTTGTVKNVTNFSVANGTLSGTAATAGTYKFTALSSDGVPNGKDASRSYNLMVVDKPLATSLRVTDNLELSHTGKLGQTVNLQVLLTEAISGANPAGIKATFSAGRNTLTAVNYVNAATVNGVTALNFTGVLPAGDNGSITLTSIDFGSNAAGNAPRGAVSNGALSGAYSKLNIQAAYLLDNTAPRITSGGTVTINENSQAVIYTAAAKDANALSYRISGANANLFNMDANTGRLSVSGNVDYEALKSSNYRISLNVIATDSNGNSSARPLVVSVKDINEATQFRTGNATNLNSANNTDNVANLTLHKNVAANLFFSPLGNDVFDPEAKAISYRISDGWLPAGLTLNSKNGAITGKLASTVTAASYSFTISADDGVLNGNDASRRYQGDITANSLLSASDSILAQSDNSVVFSLYGSFSSAGKMQLFKAAQDANAESAVGTVTTLTAASESYSATYDKTDLTDGARYFIRYISPDATPSTTDSITIPIVRDDIAPMITVPITIQASGGQNNLLNAGDIVTATVNFSEAVNITGTALLNLAIGTSTAVATYNSSLSSSSSAKFIYTIAAGDNDSDGISIAAGTLANITVTDIAGNTANLSYLAVGNQASFKVDTTAPTGTPVMVIKDTGTSTTDGITSDSSVTVSGLDTNETWEYQINGTGAWIAGTGTTFKATPGVSTYQVRQVDLAGNAGASSASLTVDYRIALAKGFLIKGLNYPENFGSSVSTVGDMNGDGLPDFIASSASAISKALISGKSYLIFGKKDPKPILLSEIENGSGGFVIYGECNSDQSGASVSAAGDVNGDGIVDLIIGSPKFGSDYRGRAYVVFGKTDNTQAVYLSQIAQGSGGFAINAEGVLNALSGSAVSSIADLNGDGLSDLIISAPNLGNDNPGRTYVIYGKTTTGNIELSSVSNGTGGFAINGQSRDYSGVSLSAAGDINGDGWVDLIIGANQAVFLGQSTVGEGRTYVIFGKSSMGKIELSNIAAGTGGFVVIGECNNNYSGYSTAAGDLNGDGLSDIIIGAPYATANGGVNAGKSYVVFGKTSSTNINLTDIASGTSSLGFVINGQNAGDYSGIAVDCAGDVNGDGLADLIVGASGALKPFSFYTYGYGKSYIVFGKTANTSAVELSAVEAGTGGFVLMGNTLIDTSGYSVAGAGDVNGDGLADLLVGAPQSGMPALSGASFIIFGKTDTKPIDLGELTSNVGGSVQYANIPTSGNDTFNGTTGSEIILGAAGNDTLSGGGGNDVLLGGAGDDVLIINADNIAALRSAAPAVLSSDLAGNQTLQLARVDGGTGIDTLRVTGGVGLDLTMISQIAASNPKVGSRISSIERIDLATDTAANTLKLNLFDVLDMAGVNLFNSGNGWTGLTASVAKHQVAITGGATDTVDIDGYSSAVGATNVWAKATGTVTNNGVTFDIWNHNTAAAQLLIQQGVIVS